MASWTPPTTHATGDILAVSDWNAVANNEVFLYDAPYGMYYNSVGVACASDTLTQVTLGGTTAAGYGFAVSSNDVVLPLAGVYTVSFSVGFPQASGGGFMWGLIQQIPSGGAGTTIVQGVRVAMPLSGSAYSPSTGVSNGSGLIYAAAGDKIRLFARQTSFASLTTQAVASQTFIHIAFVGSL